MTFDPLSTHCGICGAKEQEPCRPISKKSPPLNREFHNERVTRHLESKAARKRPAS